MQNLPNYSVLMSVYIKDNPCWLEQAIESILHQTHKTDDFVIVKDGPVTREIDNVLNKYKMKYFDIFNIVSLEKNVGLGMALNYGVLQCKNSYIARMDSDDISVDNRCELEIKKMLDGNFDIVGSLTYEFEEDISNVIAIRSLPEINCDIYSYAKKRNPFCHPSLLIKKEALLAAGNYRSFHLCEDYDMWVRMFQNNVTCYNFQQPLTYMRVNKDFYARRGGITYLKSILKFKYYCFKSHFYSFKQFLLSSVSSIVVCLLPNNLRVFIYINFLRK